MEDELQKRNTDCVYFLASPLTCRKGGECEYRHSEVARLNPRDCCYWLSGNCLNPSCAFRHPPLEKLAESASESESLQQLAPVPTAKPNVPCYFYFNGFCTKGDKCSYSHIPETHSLKYIKPNYATSPATTLAQKKPLEPLMPSANTLPRQILEHDHDERIESSPGFDVLVDDKSEYIAYEDNDEYQQSVEREEIEMYLEDDSSAGKRKSRPPEAVQDDLRLHLTKRRTPGMSQRLSDRLTRGDNHPTQNGSSSEEVFTGPKSLAQIKEEKKSLAQVKEDKKSLAQVKEDKKSDFDGPKPLSEILKHKRKVSPL